MNAFKEPLVILDQQLFEEIVAGPEETKVKDDQIWFIFFDSPHCKKCHQVLDVWEDLANHHMLDYNIHIAYMFCPRSYDICQRLGVKGYPTLSVLDDHFVYDYGGKGRLSVKDLTNFVKEKKYLELSKPRHIMH